MKHVFIILTCLFISVATLKAQQRAFTFTVNGRDCQASESQLNDFFGTTFQMLTQRRVVSQRDFDYWRDSFERWKELAINGRFVINNYGNIMGGCSYSGTASHEDLGLNDKGKSATGNPNKKDHVAQRMAILNHYICSMIINSQTQYNVSY